MASIPLRLLGGVRRRLPGAQFITPRDAGLKRAPDPEVLEWAASERCILLTHNVATVTKYACDRVRDGLPMPGVFEVGHQVPLAEAIEDIVLIITCGREGEWEGQVRYLPL